MTAKKTMAGLLAVLVWFWVVGVVGAQTPRPTPTNVPPPGGGGDSAQVDDQRGSISGFVYEDVNGDGRCVGTDVTGENPIQGIDVRFVSSDRKTVITNYSGAKGDFGLYATGQSYWEVTVLPPAGWTATTQSTVYVPVYPESLNHANINFCLTRGTNAVIRLPGASGIVLLPESGASRAEQQAAQWQMVWQVLALVTAVFGLALISSGIYLQWQRKPSN
ncbi:MAG: hypothetical protein HND44_06780 [Chloroflexi bacterium]|nr:hypothetical protein [Chloroflexota bacterium]NOG34267.1 hypothetical protein [Chloroflexota bacterium]